MKKTIYRNNKIITDISSKFEYLQNKFEQDEAFYYGLSHLFYSFEVYPYALKLINEKKNNELKDLLYYIECELEEEDPYYENVVAVSFLENLLYEDEAISNAMYIVLPSLMKQTYIDMKNSGEIHE